MENENKLEVSIIDSIAGVDLPSLVEDGIEISIDNFINDELLKEIPVVKIVVAISKGILSVRDYIFLKKMIGFLIEVEKVDFEKRKIFAEKIKKENKTHEVGLGLIEAIDKSFGEYKAKIIGKLFVVFLESETITQRDFFRLSEMVVSAYESDLKYFFETNENDIGETGDEVEHLLTIGLYERKKNAFGSTIMEAKKPTFSTYGMILKKI